MNKITVFLLVAFTLGCTSQKSVINKPVEANEPFIIYKTKADYFHNVPVIMNKERTIIVAYPAPTDIKQGDRLMLPTKLNNGFLLDNRGISPNVVFTSYTYESYSALSEAPLITELMARIIDKNPLLEYHNCRKQLSIKYNLKEVKKMVKNGFPDCE